MVSIVEVVIQSIEGRRLILSHPSPGSDEDLWSFTATLETETAKARVGVWDDGIGLAEFFAGLAEAWRGFEGERTYDSLEGNLSISCCHDRRGSIVCEMTVAQPSPPSWSLSAEMTLGGGAHVAEIASSVSAFVERGHAGAGPSEHTGD